MTSSHPVSTASFKLLYRINDDCVGLHGPARSGCLVLYHLKYIWRFLPEFSEPVFGVKEAFVDISFCKPVASPPNQRQRHQSVLFWNIPLKRIESSFIFLVKSASVGPNPIPSKNIWQKGRNRETKKNILVIANSLFMVFWFKLASCPNWCEIPNH